MAIRVHIRTDKALNTKSKMAKRLKAFNTGGGYITVLDWRDRTRDPRTKRLVWKNPQKHDQKQVGQDRQTVANAIAQAQEFDHWHNEGGEGPRSLSLRACKAFLHGSHDHWDSLLLLAWSPLLRLQGVGLCEKQNNYVGTLEILASRGELKGTGSALLQRAGQLVIEELDEAEKRSGALERQMTRRGWQNGSLEIPASKAAISMYLQYGGEKVERSPFTPPDIEPMAIYGEALQFLVGR